MEVDNKQDVAEVAPDQVKESSESKAVEEVQTTGIDQQEAKTTDPESKEPEVKKDTSENGEEKDKEKSTDSAENSEHLPVTETKADADSGKATEEESSEQISAEEEGKAKKANTPKREKSTTVVDSSVTFEGGDVVWVRITRLGWWPALVMKKEDLPADFGAIHPTTLAVVKFFNEEEFEEISKLDRIQPYECEAKLNHIKAGMTKFLEFQKRQAKNSQYVNFPVSVEEAEKLTNGDVSLAQPEKYDTKKETPAAEKQRSRRKRTATEEDDGQTSPSPKNGEGSESNGKKSKRDSSLSLSEDDNNDSLSKDPECLAKIEQVLKDIINVYILTDECLEHLRRQVSDETPSERYMVFCQDQRHLSLKLSTVGFFEGFYDLYSNVADFLTASVKKVKMLRENQHERNFILNVLLPEAVSYGISKKFSLPQEEADNYTMFGIGELVLEKK